MWGVGGLFCKCSINKKDGKHFGKMPKVAVRWTGSVKSRYHISFLSCFYHSYQPLYLLVCCNEFETSAGVYYVYSS